MPVLAFSPAPGMRFDVDWEAPPQAASTASTDPRTTIRIAAATGLSHERPRSSSWSETTLVGYCKGSQVSHGSECTDCLDTTVAAAGHRSLGYDGEDDTVEIGKNGLAIKTCNLGRGMPHPK